MQQLSVNKKLDIRNTHYLDMAYTDIIERIDLTELKIKPESLRYLPFLKGR
ncbi:MAG: nucleoid-associated protein [Candidatus Malihini olakiniferum]